MLYQRNLAALSVRLAGLIGNRNFKWMVFCHLNSCWIHSLGGEKGKRMFDLINIKLRKPTYDDGNGFIAICAEKETMRYYGVAGANITTEAQAKNQIDWYLEEFNNNGGRWIITLHDSDEYIGDIGFHNYCADSHKVEIGFRLKNKYWGQGIITKCIKHLVAYGFTNNHYNRIEALVDERNQGSKSVLIKSGFKYEGTLREYELESDGYVNLEMYSLLKREYKNLTA